MTLPMLYLKRGLGAQSWSSRILLPRLSGLFLWVFYLFILDGFNFLLFSVSLLCCLALIKSGYHSKERKKKDYVVSWLKEK